MKNKIFGAMFVLSLMFVFTIVSASTLKIGSKNSYVNTLQQSLIDKGYLKIKSPTGYFDNTTKKAVIAFQTANKLKGDGIVGPKTFALIDGSKNNSIKNLPVVNQEKKDLGVKITSSTTAITPGCNFSSSPSITITSPAGGETYTAGSNIPVAWTVCNLPVSDNGISIQLSYFGPSVMWTSLGVNIPATANSATLTLPTSFPYPSGNFYKIDISAMPVPLPYPSDGYITDKESNSFTINGTLSNTSTSITSPQNISSQLINKSSTSVSNLISFSGCGGNFSATSSGLTSVKIYNTSTGTDITTPTLFGSMNLANTSNGIQTWSLSAGSLLATDIYASGYNGTTMTNQKDYPFTGASVIYEHLFGACLH